MLLFHYSKTPYLFFKTLAMQRTITPEEKAKALENESGSMGLYYDHISFFLERIPFDIIGGLFDGTGNDFWVTGRRVYEHIIDSGELGKFKYEIVETELDRQHRKSWPENGDADEEEMYFLERKGFRVKHGYVGKTNAAFEKAAKPLIGTTRAAYINAVANPYDASSLTKYAADVPHVMIYPENTTTPIRITLPVRSLLLGAKPPSTLHTPSLKW